MRCLADKSRHDMYKWHFCYCNRCNVSGLQHFATVHVDVCSDSRMAGLCFCDVELCMGRHCILLANHVALVHKQEPTPLTGIDAANSIVQSDLLISQLHAIMPGHNFHDHMVAMTTHVDRSQACK